MAPASSGLVPDDLDDFDVMAGRLTPFATRGKTRDRLEAIAREYRERISNLEGLLEGGRLSCPICQSCEKVIITGNGRKGTKKQVCRAHHDPGFTGRDSTEFIFSTYTSYEAYKVYQDFLVEALTLLTTCEGTYRGIAKYLNISGHMVELSVQTLVDYLAEKGRGLIRVEGDPVVVYADFSGTRVSRSASIIMSRVGEEIAYQVCCTMNYLTAWNFVKGLKESLELDQGATLVFVTDGEEAWIDPIRSFFPDAVHIRQFHSRNCKGLVYVHLTQNEGIYTVYTVRFPWDVVLDEDEASEDALRMRRRRRLEGWSKTGLKADRTEVSDEVIVWEGIARHPRGRRRKEGVTVPGAMDEPHRVEGVEGVEGEESSVGSVSDSKLFEESSEKRGVSRSREKGGRIASGADGVKRVFRGRLEGALQIPPVHRVLSILVEVFGGHFITSNAAESLFNVKPALKSHRTVKSGSAFVHLMLFLRTKVRKWDGERVRSFFRGDVVTLDRLRSVTVKRKGPSRYGSDPEGVVNVVLDACRNSRPVTISYRDGRGRRTNRMIEPFVVKTDQYTGMKKVRGYCYLRDDERTFLLDRIVNAIPADTSLSIISPDQL